MRISAKAKLLLSASILAAGTTPALAQEAGPPEEIGTEDPSSAASAENDDSDSVIVVTGVRASLVRALEIKRESAQIVDAIVAEDIGKLPDNNVVDALQRVTGVQVTNRTGGEATAVTIRGLPDIATRWNGREIFTASGRQFALQDIPANLVSRIDVYKTRAAEHIESGMAGQIDVFTHRPFDFDGFAFTAAARAIYNEQADEINPNVSALLSNRWDTGAGEFGALINVSYLRNRYRDQSVTAGALVPFATTSDLPPGSGAANLCNPSNPNGWGPLERIFTTDCRAPDLNTPDPRDLAALWQAGLDEGLPMAPGSTLLINGANVPYYLARDALFAFDTLGDRKRPAVNAALQWAPNDSSQYTFEFFWDGYRNEIFNSLHFTFADWWGSLGPDPASTITLFPETNVIKTRTIGFPFGFQSGDLTRERTDSYVYALEGKWELGDRFDLKSDLTYQKSTFKTNFLAMRNVRVPEALELDFNAGGGIPSWQFLQADGSDGNALLTDPAQWGVGEFYDNAGRNAGSAWTFQADGTYDIDGEIVRALSFGIRYDDRKASADSRMQGGNGWLGWVPRMATMPEGMWYVNEGFFDGRADVPTSWGVADPRYIAENADEIRQIYNDADPQQFNYLLSDELELEQDFRVREKTSAVYLQGDFEFDVGGRPLSIQAGARLVNIDTNFTFFDDLNNNAENRGSADVEYEFLPSASIRYDITPEFRVRFAYGETIRRPGFGDLNPTLNLGDDLTNVGYAVGSGGNPNLGPTRSKNYDLAFEWYFEQDSALYATLFRRDIDGLVVPLRRVVTIQDHDRNNPSNVFIITQPVNASDGVLEGLELGFVFFPELPGLLNGLGAQGSFTWLDSNQNIPNTNELGEIIGEMSSPFFLVSDTSFNATLIYERGPVGARLSYVWRDEFLHHNEARLFANPIGVWNRPEKSLDFQLSYNVTDRFSVTADATNITDEIGHSYYRFGDAGNPTVTNFGNWLLGRTFALGLRYRFD